jgi:integrase
MGIEHVVPLSRQAVKILMDVRQLTGEGKYVFPSIRTGDRPMSDNYAVDVMSLTFAKGYLTALLGNARVVKYLASNQPDILGEFERITETNSLAQLQIES